MDPPLTSKEPKKFVITEVGDMQLQVYNNFFEANGAYTMIIAALMSLGSIIS